MQKITMYTTPWCADCRNAKRVLNDAGISFDEINIDQNESAAQQVIAWSGGRRVIPTFHITYKTGTEPVILHNPPMKTLELAFGIKQ